MNNIEKIKRKLKRHGYTVQSVDGGTDLVYVERLPFYAVYEHVELWDNIYCYTNRVTIRAIVECGGLAL